MTKHVQPTTKHADSDPETPPQPRKPLVKRLWSEWIKPLGTVLIIMCTFRSAIADWNDVPTGSMNPTILEGDRVAVNKLSYGLRVPFTFWWVWQWDSPERGEVVICHSPADGKRLVKRIIGVPGDVIELRSNRLLVNGKPADYGPPVQDDVDQILADRQCPGAIFASEAMDGLRHSVMSYPNIQGAPRDFGPFAVPDGQFFIMGDNRDRSLDSRSYGCVDGDKIVGHAFAIAGSFDRSNWYKPRWDRFARKLK
ncbi:MAG: signal peptidase I [Planctomycetes bacterium]|nr:signal peptidase I [Planctomycetota bacterium]NOG53406.1 signal peptidase I [Planctomycetota bacterium]